MASGVAKFAYVAPQDGNNGNFLELKEGDKIENIKLLDGGWWFGSTFQDGKKVRGYFPSTYCTLNERNPSGKQASYDGGALRRSNSKSLAQMQSEGMTPNTNTGGGSMARRSSINQLRMMAYGTTSAVVEKNTINNIKKSSKHNNNRDNTSNTNTSSLSPNHKATRRMSATTPLEFVDERITTGEVHTFMDKEESTEQMTPISTKGESDVVFKLKDDATNSYFSFKDGVYAWVTDE